MVMGHLVQGSRSRGLVAPTISHKKKKEWDVEKKNHYLRERGFKSELKRKLLVTLKPE